MKSKMKQLPLFILILISSMSYGQMRNWYIAPKRIDVSQNVPIVSNIPGATINAVTVSNGAYCKFDPDGPPLFYVADGEVFDKANTSLGFLQGFVPDRTSEIVIVPFVDNNYCNQNNYYIFYTSPNPGIVVH